MTRYPAHSLSVPVIMFSDAIITGRGCLRTPARGESPMVPRGVHGERERGKRRGMLMGSEEGKERDKGKRQGLNENIIKK